MQARLKKFGNVRGSLKRCAEELGLSPQAWNDYEAGKSEIGFGKVLLFAKFFDVSPTWLLTGRRLESAADAVISKDMLEYIDMMQDLVKVLNMLQIRAIQGEITEQDFGAILENAVDAIDSGIKRRGIGNVISNTG